MPLTTAAAPCSTPLLPAGLVTSATATAAPWAPCPGAGDKKAVESSTAPSTAAPSSSAWPLELAAAPFNASKPRSLLFAWASTLPPLPAIVLSTQLGNISSGSCPMFSLFATLPPDFEHMAPMLALTPSLPLSPPLPSRLSFFLSLGFVPAASPGRPPGPPACAAGAGALLLLFLLSLVVGLSRENVHAVAFG
ncbi:unnamed protein product [Ectocarpus sp. 12 AP-2014]